MIIHTNHKTSDPHSVPTQKTEKRPAWTARTHIFKPHQEKSSASNRPIEQRGMIYARAPSSSTKCLIVYPPSIKYVISNLDLMRDSTLIKAHASPSP